MDDRDFEELSSRCRQGDVVTVLSAVDADPSLLARQGYYGNRLLDQACNGRHVELADGLLRRGSDPSVRDAGGWNAILWAAGGNGQPAARIVSLLLEHGADPNSRNETWTALGLACYNDNVEAATLLLSKGADLLEVVREGKDALHWYGEGNELNSAAHPTHPPLSRETKEERRAALRAAFAQGPHPTQTRRVIEERVARRWPMMQILTGHDFMPLAARRAVLAALNPPLPTSARIPPVVISTRQQRLALLRDKVFSHEGLARLVMSFI